MTNREQELLMLRSGKLGDLKDKDGVVRLDIPVKNSVIEQETADIFALELLTLNKKENE